MQRNRLRKTIVNASMAGIMCLLFTCNLQAQMTGNELLKKYSGCQHVKPEDNKIGLTIENITKEDENSFFVQWKCTEQIMKNPRGHMLVAVYLNFIAPEDTDNMKIGLASKFRGNMGDHDKMVVTLDKPAKYIIIYFEGIDEKIPNSEEIRTSPLFFIAELGDTPKLLDKLPRYAGELFQPIVEKNKK